jgi:hypothetical protein
VKLLHDFQGLAIRLTDERRAHILEHPEMVSMETTIEETLLQPVRVVQSFSDPQARLYYRFYFRTALSGKYLCVVVKALEADAVVLAAYLIDRIKRGVTLWSKSKSE